MLGQAKRPISSSMDTGAASTAPHKDLKIAAGGGSRAWVWWWWWGGGDTQQSGLSKSKEHYCFTCSDELGGVKHH